MELTNRQRSALRAYEALFSFMDDDVNPAIPGLEAVAKSEREKLKDEDFGLPEKRKYPMTNPDSVQNAIKYFRFCPSDDQPTLARNLVKAIKKFDIEVKITKDNPFLKYYPSATIVERAKPAKKAK